MGMDTIAYKQIRLDAEGIHYEQDYDEINGRTKNWFKYPNGELFQIAQKFFIVSKGDIDFRYFILYDQVMDFYDSKQYLEKCQTFYEELQSLDFEQAVTDLKAALAYYDAYELDFLPHMVSESSDRAIVEYLLELAKQHYYVIYDV